MSLFTLGNDLPRWLDQRGLRPGTVITVIAIKCYCCGRIDLAPEGGTFNSWEVFSEDGDLLWLCKECADRSTNGTIPPTVERRKT